MILSHCKNSHASPFQKAWLLLWCLLHGHALAGNFLHNRYHHTAGDASGSPKVQKHFLFFIGQSPGLLVLAYIYPALHCQSVSIFYAYQDTASYSDIPWILPRWTKKHFSVCCRHDHIICVLFQSLSATQQSYCCKSLFLHRFLLKNKYRCDIVAIFLVWRKLPHRYRVKRCTKGV